MPRKKSNVIYPSAWRRAKTTVSELPQVQQGSDLSIYLEIEGVTGAIGAVMLISAAQYQFGPGWEAPVYIAGILGLPLMIGMQQRERPRLAVVTALVVALVTLLLCWGYSWGSSFEDNQKTMLDCYLLNNAYIGGAAVLVVLLDALCRTVYWAAGGGRWAS